MSYTALYRKFRPKTFSEVVGQDHIVQTLKNQVKTKRIGHAYLFTGGRGTGKTSSAKIFARAINCLNPQDGEPCNECEICKAMLNGSLTDVIEMDAASNNGVDDIRDIREKVNFLPTLAKYRVYIIDEVHMLTLQAFNALLKTLEEPPEHVKFILATTEPQKLLPTILSRCQRFDFKKISNEDIVKRLKVVCNEINIQITEPALNLIATLSEGAARDALSILERCISDGNTSIDENQIKDLVGIPKFVYVHNMIKSLVNQDIERCLKIKNDVLDEGKDLENFLWEMIKHTKDILMLKIGQKTEIYSEDEQKQMEELSKSVPKEELINIIYKLSEVSNKMKVSLQKTIIFETEIIKLCVKTDVLALEDRVKKIEEKIENGIPMSNVQTANIPVSTPHITKPNVVSAPVQRESYDNVPNEQPKVETKQIETVEKQEKQKPLAPGSKLPTWSNVLANVKKQGKVMLYANLINTEAVEINDMTVEIRFNNGLTDFRKNLIQQAENMNILTKEVAMICGKPMQIKLQDASSGKSANNQVAQKNVASPISQSVQEDSSNILEDLDIPINFVEEE